MDFFTLGTFLVGNALSGVIGNRADDFLCRLLSSLIINLLNRYRSRSPDVGNCHKSLHKAALNATLDILNECLRELKPSSLRGRLSFSRQPDEVRQWLEEVKRELTEELRRIDKEPIDWQVTEEAQRQVEAFLQPKGVLASEWAKEFEGHLTKLLLTDLTKRFGEPPEIFQTKIAQRPTWFERVCAFFAKELQSNPDLNAFLQTQLLAQLQSDLTTLGSSLQQALDQIFQWLHLLPDIDRRLEEIQSALAQVREELVLIRRTQEEILGWLKRQLGSEHLIVALNDRTQNFLAQIQAQPFFGRRGAWQKLTEFVRSEENGIAIVYAPAGYGKTHFLAHWLKEISQDADTFVVFHFFNRHPDLGGYAVDLSNALAHLIAQISAATSKNGFPSLSPNPDDRRAMLENLLAELKLREGEKLVVLLDGLDEAQPLLEHPPIRTALLKGLFFVVSGRWDGVGKLPLHLKG